MKIRCIPVNDLRENTYILHDETTNEGVVIDPGDPGEKVLNYIETKKIKVVAILLTHGHYDHTSGVKKLKEKSGAKVYANKNEELLLNSPEAKYIDIEFSIDEYIEDGFCLNFSNNVIKAIFTPGHTPGGISYYIDKEKVLFTGDTLFRNSIGRTDFYLGNFEDLEHSIRTKLYSLPGDTTVFPGHGLRSTIEHEKYNNPFVKELKCI